MGNKSGSGSEFGIRIRDEQPGSATLLFDPSRAMWENVPFSGDWETATPVTGSGSGCRRGAGGFTTGTCGIGTGMGPRTWGGATGMPPSRFLRGLLAGPPAFFAGRSSLLLSDSVSEMSEKSKIILIIIYSKDTFLNLLAFLYVLQ
jgi:hypothetical protein